MAHAGTPSVRDPQPPYRAAFAVFAVVLLIYVWTLAPSVTFWDAGEFIATSKILGIPHPPGTPLFVLIGHVWATIVRVGSWAYRTNLMTATFSAAAAGFFFLLVNRGLTGWGRRALEDELADDRIFTVGGAMAAALVSAFTFTVWQNSNETEVYMVATLSIAAMCWLAWLWRRSRGGERAPHLLLLIVYLAAVSLGNHLLTLLVGPAIIGFMWHVLRADPLPREQDRQIEWAQWWVLCGVWALLIGTGLGSTELLVVGGVAFAAAAIYAAWVGALPFAATVLGIAAVGASTYLFLYFRSQVGPFINEADPSTWDSLVAVIRREQYPPRSPIDNPIFLSGPDNPGRSLGLILWQIANYLQYFDWQWANSLETSNPVFAVSRLPFTLAFTTLGVFGASVVHQRDRSLFWLLLLLFLTTGPALVGYMNFKPGFSLAYDQYPSFEMHEVRERDYFFTVSFLVWGIFAGVGLAGLYRMVRDRLGGREGGRAAAGLLVFALVPLAFNARAASRAHGPEALLARDFAYDLLQSAEPYGIIFTNGDNDTFPLWYAQEVEGIRQDVSVVNLSLGNTDWYIRQLRDNPVRPFEPEQAPWFATLAPEAPPPALHSWTDENIGQLRAMLLPQAVHFRAGRVSAVLAENTPIYVKDVLILRLIQENWNRRPLYFSLTSGSGSWQHFAPHLTQEALVLRLHAVAAPDSTRLTPGVLAVPLDLPRTDTLVNQVYRYAGLFSVDTLVLGPTERNITTNLSFPFYALGQAYELRGDRWRSVEALRKAYHLNPLSQLAGLLQLESLPAFADTLLDPPAARP